jgi:hypothetical protein
MSFNWEMALRALSRRAKREAGRQLEGKELQDDEKEGGILARGKKRKVDQNWVWGKEVWKRINSRNQREAAAQGASLGP